MSKYGVISGSYFPVFGGFSPNTGKYGPEITPYLDTFHVVRVIFNDIFSHEKTEECFCLKWSISKTKHK